MTWSRPPHVDDIRAGRVALEGTKLVLRAPLPPRAPAPVNRPARGVNAPPSPVNEARNAPPGRHSSTAQSGRAKGGRDAEAFVQAFHDACARAGVAYVHKVPTPYVIERRNPGDGTFVGRYSRRVRTDYEGVMLDGTRHRDGSPRRVLAECKSDADPRGKLYLRELREHQRNALEGAVARGDVAVLLVVLGAALQRQLYAVPWRVARAHDVLTVERLAPWRVRPLEPYLRRWSRERIGR